MKISDLKIAIVRRNLLHKSEASPSNPNTFKLGILLESAEDNVYTSFTNLKKDFKLEDSEVKIVVCRQKGSKNDIFEQPSVSLKDFSWKGKVKNESRSFLNADYDVLISFTASENKMADFLVSVTRARLKVGRKIEDKNGIFDLNIAADLSTPEVFTTELKKYLNIIKHRHNE